MSDHGFPSLESLRDHIGRAPRKLGFFATPPIAFPEPDWLKPASVRDDPAKKLFGEFKSLWKDGVVSWGRIIKANRGLFQPGADDCPGEVLVSWEDSDKDAFERMPGLVKRLGEMQDMDEPPKGASQREIEWWEDMNNDMSYHEAFSLPQEWPHGDRGYKGCNVLFHRGHLPGGYIQSRTLPVLVNFRSPVVAMVVPASYWPPGLHEWLLAHDKVSLEIPPDPMDTPELNRVERESCYQAALGPIRKVFHETELRHYHVDVYEFQWTRPERREFAWVSGGMSDMDQPEVEGDFKRVELIFYTTRKEPHYPHLVRNFAHYPWETGAFVGPWHTIPLRHYAESMLGTPRFTGLLLAPMLAKSDMDLAGALEFGGEEVFFLSIIPLTAREFDAAVADIDAFVEKLHASTLDMAFDPGRPEIL